MAKERKKVKDDISDVHVFLKTILEVYDVENLPQAKTEIYLNVLERVKHRITDDKLEEIIAMYDKLPLPYELALIIIDCDYATVSTILKDINYMSLKTGAYHFENRAIAYVLDKFCKNQENIAVYVYDKFMLNKFISFELDNILRQFYKKRVVTGKFEEYDYYGLPKAETTKADEGYITKYFCFDESKGKSISIKEEKIKR